MQWRDAPSHMVAAERRGATNAPAGRGGVGCVCMHAALVGPAPSLGGCRRRDDATALPIPVAAQSGELGWLGMCTQFLKFPLCAAACHGMGVRQCPSPLGEWEVPEVQLLGDVSWLAWLSVMVTCTPNRVFCSRKERKKGVADINLIGRKKPVASDAEFIQLASEADLWW